MSKKIPSVLLSLVLFFCILACVTPVYAKSSEPAITISVKPDKAEAYPGDTIEYSVNLGPVNRWADCEFTFVIPDGLTYQSATVPDEIAEHFQGGWTEKTKKYVVYGGNYTSISDTLLLTVTCKVEESAVGKSLAIYLYDPFFCDRSGEDYTIKNYDEASLKLDCESRVAVHAKPIAVTGITIDEKLALKVGESKTPGYTVTPAEAANKGVTFKSSNTAVATVNEATGEVTGVKAGTATITVTTVDGNFTDTCLVTVTDNDPVITASAIEGEYADEVNLWLKIFVPDSFKGNKNARVVMTKDGGFGVESVTVKGDALGMMDAKGRYLLKMGIASGEMTSNVVYEFFNADGGKIKIVTASGKELGTTATFSLLDYAKSMLINGTPEQRQIVAAMLTYGGYSQKYFNVDAENPAYNLLTQIGMEIPSLDGVTADSIRQSTSVVDGKNGLKATGMQAFLDSAIYLRVYFTLDTGASIDDYKFVLAYAKPDGTEDTMELTPGYEAGKNRYYVDIENIPAAYLDYMYNVTATNIKTNATYSVTTSVMVWVRNSLNSSTNENHKNMLKAIYLYNQAANEFFGK